MQQLGENGVPATANYIEAWDRNLSSTSRPAMSKLVGQRVGFWEHLLARTVSAGGERRKGQLKPCAFD